MVTNRIHKEEIPCGNRNNNNTGLSTPLSMAKGDMQIVSSSKMIIIIFIFKYDGIYEPFINYYLTYNIATVSWKLQSIIFVIVMNEVATVTSVNIVSSLS